MGDNHTNINMQLNKSVSVISGLGCDMWKMRNFHQMLKTVAGQYTNHIILHVML